MDEGTTTSEQKKKRTRKCRDIVAVSYTPERADLAVNLQGWPSGITRKDKALAAAKKIQTEWAKDGKPVADIILMRRLATVKGSSQVVMAFSVE